MLSRSEKSLNNRTLGGAGAGLWRRSGTLSLIDHVRTQPTLDSDRRQCVKCVQAAADADAVRRRRQAGGTPSDASSKLGSSASNPSAEN